MRTRVNLRWEAGGECLHWCGARQNVLFPRGLSPPSRLSHTSFRPVYRRRHHHHHPVSAPILETRLGNEGENDATSPPTYPPRPESSLAPPSSDSIAHHSVSAPILETLLGDEDKTNAASLSPHSHLTLRPQSSSFAPRPHDSFISPPPHRQQLRTRRTTLPLVLFFFACPFFSSLFF